MEATEILGLDVGMQHTGIARASNIARLAEPLMSVPTKDVFAEIQKYAKKHKLEALVVGLPRSLQGQDTDQTTWLRDWVTKAEIKISVPIYWQDEALTSKNARNYKLKTKNSFDDHAIAAALVLQDFLDGPEAGRILA